MRCSSPAPAHLPWSAPAPPRRWAGRVGAAVPQDNAMNASPARVPAAFTALQLHHRESAAAAILKREDRPPRPVVCRTTHQRHRKLELKG